MAGRPQDRPWLQVDDFQSALRDRANSSAAAVAALAREINTDPYEPGYRKPEYLTFDEAVSDMGLSAEQRVQVKGYLRRIVEDSRSAAGISQVMQDAGYDPGLIQETIKRGRQLLTESYGLKFASVKKHVAVPPGEGWEPIPNGTHGGFRKRKNGGGYEYAYPDGNGGFRSAKEPAAGEHGDIHEDHEKSTPHPKVAKHYERVRAKAEAAGLKLSDHPHAGTKLEHVKRLEKDVDRAIAASKKVDDIQGELDEARGKLAEHDKRNGAGGAAEPDDEAEAAGDDNKGGSPPKPAGKDKAGKQADIQAKIARMHQTADDMEEAGHAETAAQVREKARAMEAAGGTGIDVSKLDSDLSDKELAERVGRIVDLAEKAGFDSEKVEEILGEFGAKREALDMLEQYVSASVEDDTDYEEADGAPPKQTAEGQAASKPGGKGDNPTEPGKVPDFGDEPPKDQDEVKALKEHVDKLQSALEKMQSHIGEQHKALHEALLKEIRDLHKKTTPKRVDYVHQRVAAFAFLALGTAAGLILGGPLGAMLGLHFADRFVTHGLMSKADVRKGNVVDPTGLMIVGGDIRIVVPVANPPLVKSLRPIVKAAPPPPPVVEPEPVVEAPRIHGRHPVNEAGHRDGLYPGQRLMVRKAAAERGDGNVVVLDGGRFQWGDEAFDNANQLLKALVGRDDHKTTIRRYFGLSSTDTEHARVVAKALGRALPGLRVSPYAATVRLEGDLHAAGLPGIVKGAVLEVLHLHDAEDLLRRLEGPR